MSNFMCHIYMSHVKCHMSCVLKIKYNGQSGEASRWRVCYQYGLLCLVKIFNTQESLSTIFTDKQGLCFLEKCFYNLSPSLNGYQKHHTLSLWGFSTCSSSACCYYLHASRDSVSPLCSTFF